MALDCDPCVEDNLSLSNEGFYLSLTACTFIFSFSDQSMC